MRRGRKGRKIRGGGVGKTHTEREKGEKETENGEKERESERKD